VPAKTDAPPNKERVPIAKERAVVWGNRIVAGSDRRDAQRRFIVGGLNWH
jgi:hypothetical protein